MLATVEAVDAARMAIVSDSPKHVELRVYWRCRCTHDLRGHRAGAGCTHCRCDAFASAVRSQHTHLAELDDLQAPHLPAGEADLIAEVFTRVETLGACRGWAEKNLTHMVLDVERLPVGVVGTVLVDLAPLSPMRPQAEREGTTTVAAAILGPSRGVLAEAGHHGIELYGLDLDGRTYVTQRCGCCGSRAVRRVTPGELSRRHHSDPLRSTRAAGLAVQLAPLLASRALPSSDPTPAAQA